MDREELKAYEGESIYRVLEYTPHDDDELHLMEVFNAEEEFKFYVKSEADAVMDAYERRIQKLTNESDRWYDMWCKAYADECTVRHENYSLSEEVKLLRARLATAGKEETK